ncbi:hypothetical protein SESBI_40364 [Sesbania bispinosa]|nr:hypothetical protein SESBI_40364 [Sesbania bispinosa]
MSAKSCLAESPSERATVNHLRLQESPLENERESLENVIVHAASENHHRKSPLPRMEITAAVRLLRSCSCCWFSEGSASSMKSPSQERDETLEKEKCRLKAQIRR